MRLLIVALISALISALAGSLLTYNTLIRNRGWIETAAKAYRGCSEGFTECYGSTGEEGDGIARVSPEYDTMVACAREPIQVQGEIGRGYRRLLFRCLHGDLTGEYEAVVHRGKSGAYDKVAYVGYAYVRGPNPPPFGKLSPPGLRGP